MNIQDLRLKQLARVPRQESLSDRVTDEFLAEIRAENGGKLPSDLIDPKTGEPRPLTRRHRDAAYRRRWLRIRRRLLDSQARPQTAGSSQHCDVTPPPQPAPASRCRHEKLLIRCKHAERVASTSVGETLQDLKTLVTPGKEGRHFEYEAPNETTSTFEVVCGFWMNPDKLRARTTFPKGPCKEFHKKRVFDLWPDPDRAADGQRDDEIDFKVRSRNLLQVLQDNPLALLWPEWIAAERYQLSALTCENKHAVEILAYPDLQWSVGVAFGLGDSKSTHGYYNMGQVETPGMGDEKLKYQGYTASKREVGGRFKFEGKVAVLCDGVNYDITAQYKKYIDQGTRLINVAKDVADYMGPRLQSLGGSKLTVNWPMVSLGGKWGWEEIPDKPKCGYAYEVGVKADPVIGLSLKVDVLLALCNVIPGLGAALARWKYMKGDYNEDNTKNLSVDLTVSGSIFVEAKYKKSASKDKAEVQGKAGGKIGLQLEANFKFEKKYACKWFVVFAGSSNEKQPGISVGAAFKAGGKAEISPYWKFGVDGDLGPYHQWVLEFSGLSVYASAGATLNTKIKPRDPDIIKNGKYVKGPTADSQRKDPLPPLGPDTSRYPVRDPEPPKEPMRPDEGGTLGQHEVHEAALDGNLFKAEKVLIPPAKWLETKPCPWFPKKKDERVQ